MVLSRTDPPKAKPVPPWTIPASCPWSSHYLMARGNTERTARPFFVRAWREFRRASGRDSGLRQRSSGGALGKGEGEHARWAMPESIDSPPKSARIGGLPSARTGETAEPPHDDISGTIPTHARVADCESAGRPRRFSRPVVHAWAREKRNRANERHPASARSSPTTRRCETKPPGFGEAWKNTPIPTTSRSRDQSKPFPKSVITRRCETKPPGSGEAWRNVPIPATSRPSDRASRSRDQSKPFPKSATTCRCETKPPGFGENSEAMTVDLKGGSGGVPSGSANGFWRSRHRPERSKTNACHGQCQNRLAHPDWVLPRFPLRSRARAGSHGWLGKTCGLSLVSTLKAFPRCCVRSAIRSWSR